MVIDQRALVALDTREASEAIAATLRDAQMHVDVEPATNSVPLITRNHYALCVVDASFADGAAHAIVTATCVRRCLVS
jgi:menaquinone-dependent protoporphyrinogen IX oxidase